VKHQYFLKNKKFPPVSTTGECKTGQEIQLETSSGMAKLVLGMESRQEEELVMALESSRFRTAIMRFYKATIIDNDEDAIHAR